MAHIRLFVRIACSLLAVAACALLRDGNRSPGADVHVELEQRMYEPERNRFDWDNPEMRILYRQLDWCQRRG
jgi:hypothetical protein